MHIALRISEVLRYICEYADDRTLLAMAQTAQVLHQPAVEMIWHELPSLVYLFMCFPEDTWTLEDDCYLVFTRTLAPKDWTAFLRYATLVRQLGAESDDCSCPWEVSEAAWMKMCSLRLTQILFPHLRSITRYPELLSKELLPSLLTTVGTSLIKLDLKLLFPGEDVQGTLQASFGVIAERFPALRELYFGDYSCLAQPCDIPETVNALSTMARGFTALVSFTSADIVITQTAIDILLRLQTLRCLHVSLPDYVTRPSERIPPGYDALPPVQLEEIELYHLTTQAYLAFSQAVALPHATKLVLSFSDGVPTHLITDLFSSIRIQCSPYSLTAIEIHGGLQGPLLPAHLRPLLDFKHLEHLNLKLSCQYALDDSFCSEMAMAWPGLVYLQIGRESLPRYEVLPSVTVRALPPFAIHCPKLQHLGLVLHATLWENKLGAFNGDDIEAELYGTRLADRASTSALSTLSLGRSPLRGLEYTAVFLARLFPKLKKVDSRFIRDGWEEVSQLMDLFKLTRQDGRLRMIKVLAEGAVETHMVSSDD